jgi:hypothetical protein
MLVARPAIGKRLRVVWPSTEMQVHPQACRAGLVGLAFALLHASSLEAAATDSNLNPRSLVQLLPRSIDGCAATS